MNALKAVSLAFMLCFFWAKSAISADGAHAGHDAWKSVTPYDASVIQKAARGVTFSKTSSEPPEAQDVLDYFDAIPKVPELKRDSVTLLGIMHIKTKGVEVRGTGKVLPAGEYYHWIGHKSGTWIGGVSSVKGSFTLSTEVLFGEMPTESKHKMSTHVFVHDPKHLDQLKQFANAMAAGPIPGWRPPPPPPPRCILKCKYIVDLDDGLHKWVPTIWLRVP